eukprot:scaffold320_cov362-Prasinococcus_capsulatus_cf.AAC.3
MYRLPGPRAAERPFSKLPRLTGAPGGARGALVHTDSPGCALCGVAEADDGAAKTHQGSLPRSLPCPSQGSAGAYEGEDHPVGGAPPGKLAPRPIRTKTPPCSLRGSSGVLVRRVWLQRKEPSAAREIVRGNPDGGGPMVDRAALPWAPSEGLALKRGFSSGTLAEGACERLRVQPACDAAGLARSAPAGDARATAVVVGPHGAGSNGRPEDD